MNKPSIFTGLAGMSALFKVKALRAFGEFPYPHVKEVQTMLWPSYRGTYVRAKHGELKDESGRPRYA